ncbi:MAG: hypothetical protein ACLQO6_03545 [Desulfomonilaceae bacterium]
MQKQIESKLNNYRKAVDELFARIEDWLKQTDLKTIREKIEINEASPGKYQAEMLIIKDPNGVTVVKLRPVGAWIIAADGRVDIEGAGPSEELLYWEKGAPEIKTPTNGKGRSKTLTVKRLFRGADKPGWYWLDNVRLGRARSLDDKELFLDIIRMVSMYES